MATNAPADGTDLMPNYTPAQHTAMVNFAAHPSAATAEAALAAGIPMIDLQAAAVRVFVANPTNDTMQAALISGVDPNFVLNIAMDKAPGLVASAKTAAGAAAGAAKDAASTVASTAETFARLANDLVNPHFWVRVGEFLVGGVLVIVGVGGMMKAGQKARSAARTTERGARVAYSVTPAGSKISKAAQSTARAARRSRA